MKKKAKNKITLPLAKVFVMKQVDFSDLQPGDVAIIPENDPVPFVVKSKPFNTNIPGILSVRVGKFKP